jgi:glycosyltransferase involved in cell wall biosynthesis
MPAALEGLQVLAFADWYSPDASGGAERAAWEIYKRLGAAGARVHVVSAAHGEPHDDPGVTVTPIKGYDLSKLAGGYLAPAPNAFPTGNRLARSLDADVLHSNTLHYTGCIAAAWVAKRQQRPLVTTAQLGPLDHLPASTRRFADIYERTFGRYILRRSDHVLAVSEPARRHVISLGARAADVSLAPNGVEHARFAMPPIEGGDNPLIISVGRLLVNKGAILLVEAAGELARAGVRFRMAFVGDGQLRGQLEARVRELGIGDRVQFVGHVRNPEAWIEKAEVVVRASYTEGLSLAVLEAMAAGRCNLVSDIPANKELIVDGDNGLLFTCGDAHDLARALRRAIDDPELRRRTARQALEDSLQYTWDRMARLHAEAFVESVESRGPR